MPTSDHHNIVPIVTVITNLEPKSVLDVGCGFGKYGVLLREYLDVWQGRVKRPDWKARIEGIDAFEGYRNPIWDFAYDKVHVGEAQSVLPTLDRFDVVLIADVIEHFPQALARTVASQCLDRGSVVVVSTPREFYEQGNSNGNVYERHLCLFTERDFPSGTHVATIPGLSCNIYVASARPLPAACVYPTSYSDLLYIRSRARLQRLGRAGWPLSAGLRTLGRWLG